MSTVNLDNSKRIGVVSISPNVDITAEMTFDDLYVKLGRNSGNLMFTQAMFSLLEGDVKHIGFSFDPVSVNRDFDVVVVPAANWLNKNANWDFLAERLELLEIPIVAIGLGLQADTTNIDDVVVSESALRLAKVFSKSAPNISVRGEFTRAWLESVGIQNVVVTGCPSLYMNIFNTDEDIYGQDVTLQSTRYAIGPGMLKSNGINRKLFYFCGEFGMPMVYQSEPEEMEFLTHGKRIEALEPNKQKWLVELYGKSNVSELEVFLREKTRIFVNLNQWSEFVRGCCGVLGTRLHGSIIALNSGRPAVLIPHDSRTAEAADFAGIPIANGPDVVKMNSVDELRQLLSAVKLEKYKDVRSKNRAVFLQFLSDSGLKPNAQNMF